ncbi:MAG: hypothetical protein K0U12_05170 [Gammaproteobacteria bacterium]|nr:hypothetical protein [Gammaproteobacteria bacterium]
MSRVSEILRKKVQEDEKQVAGYETFLKAQLDQVRGDEKVVVHITDPQIDFTVKETVLSAASVSAASAPSGGGNDSEEEKEEVAVAAAASETKPYKAKLYAQNGENVIVANIALLRAIQKLAADDAYQEKVRSNLILELTRDTHRSPDTRSEAEIAQLQQGHSEEECKEFLAEEAQELKDSNPAEGSFGEHCIVNTPGVNFPQELQTELGKVKGQVSEYREFGKITFSPKSARLLDRKLNLAELPDPGEPIFQGGEGKSYKEIVAKEKLQVKKYIVSGICGEVCVEAEIDYLLAQGVAPQSISLLMPATHFLFETSITRVVKKFSRLGVHIERLDIAEAKKHVLGDMQASLPRKVTVENSKIKVAINLDADADSKAEEAESKDAVAVQIAGTIMTGSLPITNLHLLANAFASGQLKSSDRIIGLNDRRFIELAKILSKSKQKAKDFANASLLPYVVARLGEIKRLIVNGNSNWDCCSAQAVTYTELKQQYAENFEEPEGPLYIETIAKAKEAEEAEEAKEAKEVEAAAKAKFNDNTEIDKNYLEGLYTWYQKQSTTVRERLFIQFYSQKYFSLAEGYETLLLNELVEWIRGKLQTWFNTQSPEDQAEHKGTVEGFLNNLYRILTGEDSDKDSADAGTVIKGITRAIAEFKEKIGNDNVFGHQFKNIETEWNSLDAKTFGLKLHQRVVDLLENLKDPKHRFGKLLTGGDSVPDLIQESQQPLALSCEVSEEAQTISVSNKRVPLPLITANGMLFANAKSVEDGVKHVPRREYSRDASNSLGKCPHQTVIIPSQEIVLQEGDIGVNGFEHAKEAHSVSTIETIYDEATQSFKAGLPHFIMPNRINLQTATTIDKGHQVAIMGWYKEAGKYIAVQYDVTLETGDRVVSLHSLKDLLNGVMGKKDVEGGAEEDVLGDYSRRGRYQAQFQIDQLPGLRAALITQVNELHAEEFKALLNNATDKAQLLVDMLPHLSEARTAEISKEFLENIINDPKLSLENLGKIYKFFSSANAEELIRTLCDSMKTKLTAINKVVELYSKGRILVRKLAGVDKDAALVDVREKINLAVVKEEEEEKEEAVAAPKSPSDLFKLYEKALKIATMHRTASIFRGNYNADTKLAKQLCPRSFFGTPEAKTAVPLEHLETVAASAAAA